MTGDILQDAIKLAEEQLVEHMEYTKMDRDARLMFLERPDDDGTLHEIVDGSVPTYTGDLLEAARQDNYLATNEPDIGPAFDGSPTPVNIIAANFYEAVDQALWTEIARLKDEIEDEEEER